MEAPPEQGIAVAFFLLELALVAATHCAALTPCHGRESPLNAEARPCFVQEAMRQLPKERSYAYFQDILVMFVRKESPKRVVSTTNAQLAATFGFAEFAKRRLKRAITLLSHVPLRFLAVLDHLRFAAPDCNLTT